MFAMRLAQFVVYIVGPGRGADSNLGLVLNLVPTRLRERQNDITFFKWHPTLLIVCN